MPVGRLSVWKRTFSASEVAGSIATGEVTSDSFNYPCQKGRGATPDLLQELPTEFRFSPFRTRRPGASDARRWEMASAAHAQLFSRSRRWISQICAATSFSRAVALELSFFEAAYGPEFLPKTTAPGSLLRDKVDIQLSVPL